MYNNKPFGEFNGSASDAYKRGSSWTVRSFSCIWPTYALDERIGSNKFGFVLVTCTAFVLANTKTKKMY